MVNIMNKSYYVTYTESLNDWSAPMGDCVLNIHPSYFTNNKIPNVVHKKFTVLVLERYIYLKLATLNFILLLSRN